MQSRLVAAFPIKTTNWVFSVAQNHALPRLGFLSFSRGRGRTAEPTIHSGDYPEGVDADEAAKATSKEIGPFATSKLPYNSSPQLQSTGVNPPMDPKSQQKRHWATVLDNVICVVGLDGTPLRIDVEERRGERKIQEDDDKEYFKHHKATPLSEIEVADTRKPITRATDGTAGDGDVDVDGWKAVVLPDTAEEALRRASEIWRHNAIHGDPDSPQSRVLRSLRGE